MERIKKDTPTEYCTSRSRNPYLPVKLFFFFFWPCHMACKILVPQPGIEPVPPALEAGSPNLWTTREVPKYFSHL